MKQASALRYKYTRASLLFLLVSAPVAFLSTAGVSAAAGSVPSSGTSQGGAVNPITSWFWVNGLPGAGLMNFSVPQGEQTSFTISAEYPIASANVPSINMSFSVAPFPVTSVVPSWLSLVHPDNLTVVPGKVQSTALLVALGSSVPDGSSGQFELRAAYTDPLTGWHIQQIMTIRVTADSSAPTVQPQSKLNPLPPYSGGTSSWALGVGVCSSNNTGNCGSLGVAWSSATAVKSSFTVPSWDYPTSACSSNCVPSYFVETLGIAYNYILQLAIGQWYYGASNSSSPADWGELLAVVQPITNGYSVTDLGASSITSGHTITMTIGYDGASEWDATDGSASTWYFNGYFSGVPNVTNIFEYNQEPFAFESYDTTGADFNSLYVSIYPSVQYYTSAWHTPNSAIALPSSAGHSSWCGSGFCSIVGSQAPTVSTPTSFVEGGNSECNTVSVGQIYIGSDTQGILSSCGSTNTFETLLWG
jgi:hypothetical protein